MKYIKLFENWTESTKTKTILLDIEEILLDISDIGIDVNVKGEKNFSNFYTIELDSKSIYNKRVKGPFEKSEIEVIEVSINKLSSYLFDEENLGIFQLLIFYRDKENKLESFVASFDADVKNVNIFKKFDKEDKIETLNIGFRENKYKNKN